MGKILEDILAQIQGANAHPSEKKENRCETHEENNSARTLTTQSERES